MRRRYSGSQKGQSLVEFSLVLPVILVMVLGMVELGFAISHNTTIETATRQGARVGSQLVNGGGTLGCGTGQSPNWTTVDQQIIAAVEGVLVSPGSPVDRTQVQSIKIFLPDASTGAMTATLETWIPGTGPTLPGASSALHFKRDSGNWNACSRTGVAPAASIGVQIVYKYKFITPLGALVSTLSSQQIVMSDQTVMALEPPAQ
jgi:hypothetical protein